MSESKDQNEDVKATEPEVRRSPVFVTTHWSEVLQASWNDTTQAQQALE